MALTVLDLLTRPELDHAGLGLLQQRADEEPQVHAADPPGGQAGHLAQRADDGEIPAGDEEVLLRPDRSYKSYLDQLGIKYLIVQNHRRSQAGRAGGAGRRVGEIRRDS